MQNTQELQTEQIQTDPQLEQVETSDQDQDQDQGPTPPTKSIVEQMIDRRTGLFPIKMDLTDLKWIKNQCNSGSFSFTGPNEAFMVMNCYMGFSSAVAKVEHLAKEKIEYTGIIEVQASAIEAAAILLNNFNGSGLDSAQRVFRIAMALNPIIMDMKTLDQIISELRQQSPADSEQEMNAVDPDSQPAS
jgi:hypothetical protein